jgi:hypothetical protein
MNTKEKLEDFIHLMESKPEICAKNIDEYITLYSYSLYLLFDKDHSTIAKEFTIFFEKIIRVGCLGSYSWNGLCKQKKLFIEVKNFRKTLELEIFK